jgi:hypothetical protein
VNISGKLKDAAEKALWNQKQRAEWARQHESRESYKRELQQLHQLPEQQRANHCICDRL